MSIGGRPCIPTKVHRLAYQLWIGKIPEGMYVCHACDVPHCVNPKHLFLGTHADNMADIAKKGRWTPRDFPRGKDHWTNKNPGCHKGEKNPNSKLTDKQVKEILKLARSANPPTQRDLARRFGVSQPRISKIIQNAH